MTNRELRKLQLIQLMILKDIVKLCELHGLRYYLVEGTLLGAVRHNGSIPWDDDIDIAMYREDYKKIESLISRDYNDKYVVQSPDNDINYPRQILKVRLAGTKQIEHGMDGINAANGIYIDIFPLDKCKKPDGIIMKFRGMLIRSFFAYNTIHCGRKVNMSISKKTIRLLTRWVTVVIPKKKVNNWFEKICTMDDKKECHFTTSFLSAYGWKKQMVSNDVYGIGVMLTYEGEEFRVPTKYDKLLRAIYNDYLTIPSQEKQNSGHTIVEIDFGKYEKVFYD
jgi:lipopolysaccharide cholinephosphotransferase